MDNQPIDRVPVVNANLKALGAGYVYSETAELISHSYALSRTKIPLARYHHMTVNEVFGCHT